MSYFKKRIKSFGHAFNGLFHAIKSEAHLKIHLLAVVIVCAAGWHFEVSRTEWLALILCFGLVIGLELINTAIEKLADKLHPEHDPVIGQVKDIAAAAVLVAAIISVVVAGIVFLD